QAYLKVLMDEIFGEENFVTNFIWQKKNGGSASDSRFIKILNEHIIMYAKNINLLRTNTYLQNLDDGSYKLKDEHFKTRGLYKLNQMDRASLSWSKELDYIIEIDNQKFYAGGSQENWLKRQNGYHAEKDWRWRWSKEKLLWGIENNFIVLQNNKIYSKQYQFVNNQNESIERDSKFDNLILNIHGSIGTDEQKNIFNTKVFDHPKPSKLINYLINLHPNKNARILDFFAGSGTTGHAILALNQEDGGNRTFTLVTNNENEIGTNVCYERLYRINNGVGTKKETDFDWINKNKPYQNNLNVYELKYFNTNPIEIDNNEIKEVFTKMLIDFNNINKTNLLNESNQHESLINLSTLKSINKKE
ncbi:DNA methyltransferase, partial [Ureaplasma parvum]|uniref:DNA methyltransferase n=1 Tax=Ureaplasma parvum TaxID=134821 RepID=UPI0026EE3D76